MLILAGGFGTRLKSAVADVPKPLAPVHGKPFLYFLVQSLYRQGVRDIVLSLFNDADKIETWVKYFEKPGDLSIRCVVEPEAMGTGGAIAYCRDQLNYNGDIFVCNGDTYFDSGLELLGNSSESSIGLVHVQNCSRYGLVKTNSTGLITEFLEKTPSGNGGLINSGLYWVVKKDLKNLKSSPHSLEKDVFPRIAKENRLKGILLQTLFIDIGVPDDYNKFISMVQNKEVIDSWHQILKKT